MFKNKKERELVKDLFIEEPYFTAAGVFFGFPLCCVEGFNKDTNIDTKEKYPDGPYIGTGFIPCLCCADDINKHNSWEQFQNKINKNRKNTSAFPDEGSFQGITRFFYKLCIELSFDPMVVGSYFDDPEILDVIKQEIKIDTNQLKQNVLFKDYIEKTKNINLENCLDFVLNDITLNKFLTKEPINELTYLLLNNNSIRSYEDLTTYMPAKKIVLSLLKDNLDVVTRNVTKKAYKSIEKELENKLYEYCYLQSYENVQQLKNRPMKYKRLSNNF